MIKLQAMLRGVAEFLGDFASCPVCRTRMTVEFVITAVLAFVFGMLVF
jgi:hypothetical protein